MTLQQRQKNIHHVVLSLIVFWMIIGVNSFAFQKNKTVLFLPSKSYLHVSEWRNTVTQRKMKEEDEDKDREDYARKVARAEKAIAEVQEAKRKLSLGKDDDEGKLRTRLMRCQWSKTDAGTLELVWPCEGMNTGSVMSLAFSVAWFSAIIPTTFASLTAIPFLLPFWIAGGMVAKNAVVDPLVETTMSIGQYAYQIQINYVLSKNKKITLKSLEGATENLNAANVDLSVVVNGVPQYELRIFDKNKASTHTIAATSNQEELLFLANEINGHLQQMNLLL